MLNDEHVKEVFLFHSIIFLLNSLNDMIIVTSDFNFQLSWNIKFDRIEIKQLKLLLSPSIALEIDSFGFMKKIKLANNCINFFKSLIPPTPLYLWQQNILRVEHLVPNLHIRYDESNILIYKNIFNTEIQSNSIKLSWKIIILHVNNLRNLASNYRNVEKRAYFRYEYEKEICLRDKERVHLMSRKQVKRLWPS